MVGVVHKFYDKMSLYLVLELVPAGHLLGAIRKRGPFDNATAAFYFANIVCGLDFLHSHHIAHRDLKPENILMGSDGYLCIADFGYAMHEIDDDDVDWKRQGTPAYMPPEVVSGSGFLPRSADWWAAGCVLYEMVCRNLVGSTRHSYFVPAF